MRCFAYQLGATSFLWTLVHSAAGVTVSTTAGNVQGGQCNASTADAFLAIPYALPPTGDLRFAAPVPYNMSYSGGALQATTSAPACIQFGSQFLETGATSEDCLFLDIWRPANTTNTSSLPVKVWIYGGSETAGGISDPLYNGCNLAAKGDSIVVSINYRLGPLGFLALPDAKIGGNFAIQDILLGLQWVQTNIASFGGDPKKVLLFGQSAGAANVFVISTLSQAPSLMNAVISESGGGRLYAGDGVAEYSASFASLINCSTSDAQCLRSASLPTLHTTVNSSASYLKVERGNTDGWTPRIDGTVVVKDPGVVGSKVPAMFGSNTEEGTLFAVGYYASKFSTLNQTDYTAFLTSNFGAVSTAVEALFPLTAFNSTPYPAFFAISTVFSYASYRCSAYRGLQLAVNNSLPAYTYLWAQAPSCSWYSAIPQSSAILSLLGATHTAEIPFVFGETAGLPEPNGTCAFHDKEVAISEAVVAAWTAMATKGDPSTAMLAWPAWNASASLGIEVLNGTTAGVVDYQACKLFLEIDEAVVAGNGTAGGSSTASGTGTATGSGTGSATSSTSSPTSKNGASAVTGLGVWTLGVVFAGVFLLVI